MLKQEDGEEQYLEMLSEHHQHNSMPDVVVYPHPPPLPSLCRNSHRTSHCPPSLSCVWVIHSFVCRVWGGRAVAASTSVDQPPKPITGKKLITCGHRITFILYLSLFLLVLCSVSIVGGCLPPYMGSTFDAIINCTLM